MAQHRLSVAIVGAGIGGLTAAATLQQIGLDVQVYEQARQFARVGAGIQMMPNSMKVLRGIGVEAGLRQAAFAPYSHLNRMGETGEITNELPMPETRYSAPYLCMHRATLHAALSAAVPSGQIHLGKKLVGLEQRGSMAQGAATSIEDAAVLARCLADVDGQDVEVAFQRYEAHRKPRTAKIQAISSANTWLQRTEPDTDWLYGYDAWSVPLDNAAGRV